MILSDDVHYFRLCLRSAPPFLRASNIVNFCHYILPLLWHSSKALESVLDILWKYFAQSIKREPVAKKASSPELILSEMLEISVTDTSDWLEPKSSILIYNRICIAMSYLQRILVGAHADVLLSYVLFAMY